MSSDKTPSELIDHIGDIIRDRGTKNLPTFYTISIEQYGKTTPVIERETGHENFKKQILKFMSDYNLNAITVQLFHGKSRKVKAPFQSFKVDIKKQNPTFSLGTVTEFEKETEVTQMESGVSISRYYDEKFELQMRIMRSEMEKQSLLERVQYLTEKYEDRIKDQENRNREKVQDLEQDIRNYENEIAELQREIARSEKEKHNSLGNVALGSVAGHALEKFAISKVGMSLLEGFLSKEGFATLKGHLNGLSGTETEQPSPEKETARIITQPASNSAPTPRQVALAYIQKISEGLTDIHLRMIYDIAELTAKNLKDLEVIYSVAKQIQEQRKKTVVKDEKLAPLKNPVTSNSETKNEEPEQEAENEQEETEDQDNGQDLNN